MKLNIGCGHRKFSRASGWINTDISKQVKPDIVFNLEDGIPFRNNSIEEILLDNVIEHINNIFIVFSEINRVLKYGGKCIIRVPHYRSYNAFTDPTHKRYFTTKTFKFFVDKQNYYKEFNYKNELKINKIHIKYSGGFLFLLRVLVEPLANIYPEIFERYFIIPPEEIEIELIKSQS